ncbi:Guanine nucleotide-binding protein subunit gamma [Colletotrichum trifolii]|uniref:Guanine nucleotide-binding protein subunit gamma n=1 Tax=Colletotrichum trifolii TaxID=5466 RepID=A0A4R8RGK2_COLTR|nr:Guanine nucleotide-binding protein subunit gamma [Colletotrichum trifolii]
MLAHQDHPSHNTTTSSTAAATAAESSSTAAAATTAAAAVVTASSSTSRQRQDQDDRRSDDNQSRRQPVPAATPAVAAAAASPSAVASSSKSPALASTMPQYTSRDVGDPSQIKKNKQSMADLKLRRLTELNNRLREDLERERIPVSNASKSIIAYCNSTRDYMVPSVWGAVPRGEDPYAPQQSGGCCLVM